MKKLLYILLGLLLMAGCGQNIKSYQEITFNKLETKFDQKEDFVLFIGSEDCSHCQSYKPKLEAVIKVNQVKVYYIDISKLTLEENKKLNEVVPYSGTPYTVFIEDGKLKEIDSQIYTITGDRDIEYIEKIFKKNGYIK